MGPFLLLKGYLLFSWSSLYELHIVLINISTFIYLLTVEYTFNYALPGPGVSLTLLYSFLLVQLNLISVASLLYFMGRYALQNQRYYLLMNPQKRPGLKAGELFNANR